MCVYTFLLLSTCNCAQKLSLKALIHANLANEAHLPHHKEVELSTYGIIFLGTPHLGSDVVSLAHLLLQIQSIYSPTNDVVLQHLKRDSETLQQQLLQYASISMRFDTKFFFEAYATRLLGGMQKVASLQNLSPRSRLFLPVIFF
jgi:hypothetical protein